MTVKSFIRPFITASLIIGVIGCIWAEIPMSDWYKGITTTAMIWLFSSREIEKRRK